MRMTGCRTWIRLLHLIFMPCPVFLPEYLHPGPCPAIQDRPSYRKMRGEGMGGEVNGGHFSLRLPVFPARMTRFPRKMAPLFEETPFSGSGWRESTHSLPGNGGLRHYYSGGSAERGAGGFQGGGENWGPGGDFRILLNLDLQEVPRKELPEIIAGLTTSVKRRRRKISTSLRRKMLPDCRGRPVSGSAPHRPCRR
jgi:hypothetical protein